MGKNVFEQAVEARADVARMTVLVDAAQAAWEAAFREADPGADLPSDPEPGWSEPASEEEAERDLRVARLGGELVAARQALEIAKRNARAATRTAMDTAAHEGRVAWRVRNNISIR